MAGLQQQILDLIGEHHVLTLATCYKDEPYCANVFYAFLEEEQLFVFSSENSTEHMKQIAHNMFVAASIFLETDVVGKTQGMQLQGMVYQPKDELKKKAKRAYMQRFPYASLIETSFWILEPIWVKLTDDRLGFGKKLTWEKDNIVDTDFLNPSNKSS
jgi:uncharacterized protein YhbP (UPF0306 family)